MEKLRNNWKRMKRSDVLYGILFLMFLGLLIVGFTVPQPVLDENEIYFVLVIMPIMGILWFWAYLEGIKGN
jgi:hypothetical protein